MSLLNIVEEYCAQDDKADRALFETAMIDKITKDGYKMADLLYELFVCQGKLELMRIDMEGIQEQLLLLQGNDAKEKKPKAVTKRR